MFEVAPKETAIKANWDEANLYCTFCNHNGYTDWRLPTIEELDYIYNSKNDFVGSYYWSSTEYRGNYAWLQYFSSSGQHFKHKGYSYYVRAVRSLS